MNYDKDQFGFSVLLEKTGIEILRFAQNDS